MIQPYALEIDLFDRPNHGKAPLLDCIEYVDNAQSESHMASIPQNELKETVPLNKCLFIKVTIRSKTFSMITVDTLHHSEKYNLMIRRLFHPLNG